jgi:superfamily II DNA or RNA helicase
MAKRGASPEREPETEQRPPLDLALSVPVPSILAWAGVPESMPHLQMLLAETLAALQLNQPLYYATLAHELLVYRAHDMSVPDIEDTLIEPLEPAELREHMREAIRHHTGSGLPAPMFLVLPGYAHNVQLPPHDRPVCSLHELDGEEHLRFAIALTELLVPYSVVMAWSPVLVDVVHSLFIQHKPASDLCLVAHETLRVLVAAHAEPRAVYDLLLATPAAFLVDAFAGFLAPLMAYVTAAAPRYMQEAVAEAQRVRPIRVDFYTRLRLLRTQQLARQLSPYQEATNQWMAEKPEHGGIISAEAGLGKTATLLAYIRMYSNPNGTGPTLVLAPSGVLPDWKTENATMFQAPHRLRIFKWHGKERPPLPYDQFDVVLTTVETLYSVGAGMTAYWPRFRRLVLDESHALVNAKGEYYKNLMAFVAAAQVQERWGMTATPFRNSSTDIDAQLRLFGIVPNAQPLRHVYFVRYGRNTHELPPIVDVILRVPLDPLEQNLYRHIYDYTKQLDRTYKKANREVKQRVFGQLQGAMHKLRWAAISFDLIPPATVEEMRRVTVEAIPTGLLYNLWGAIANRVTRWIATPDTHGPVPTHRPALPLPYPDLELPADRRLGDNYVSSRFAEVMRILAVIRRDRPDEKVLIFSGYVQTLKLLMRVLNDRAGYVAHVDTALYTGETKPSERDAIRKRFKEEATPWIMCINYKAGGAGINIQRANNIILLDMAWVPALDVQAIARAQRRGQQRTVYVYRLRAPGTIDERVSFLRQQKEAEWDKMLTAADGDEDAAAEMVENYIMAHLFDDDDDA